MLWFFGMGMLGVTMLLQNFFRNSSLIAMVVPFVFFIPTGVALTIILGPIISRDINNWVQYLFWFPTFPFSVAAVSLLDKSDIVYFEVEVAVAWVFLIIQCPLYFMLHLYVEAIIPDNYGIKKGCCFCFNSCRKRHNNTNSVENIEMNDINAAQSMTDLAPDAKGGVVRRASTVKFDANDPI